MKVEEIIEQLKKDYKGGKSIGINVMVERHGYDLKQTQEAMKIFVNWDIEDRDKRKVEDD